MFSKDSERGRLRGPSWESRWNSHGSVHDYGHTSSFEGQEDFRRQSVGERSYERRTASDSSDSVCQNYLRNQCNRGSSCPYQHPPPPLSGSIPRPAATLNSKKLQNAWLNFCPDFQRGQCPYSDDCRLLHVSKEDEAEYRECGDISTDVVEQAMSKAMVMDWAYVGKQPHCKNYLQGSCNLRDCRFRHLNTDQYVVEVLQALREKFEIYTDGAFHNLPVEHDNPTSGPKADHYEANHGFHGMNTQETTQYGDRKASNRTMDNKERDQYGNRKASNRTMNNKERDHYGMIRDSRPPMGIQAGDRYAAHEDPVDCEDYREPQTKRMRSEDSNYQTGSRGENRQNNRGNHSYSASPISDKRFLEKLRSEQFNLPVSNEKPKKTAQHLEGENAELRKALRLALNLNAYARSLPEFRNQLQSIMSSLREKGFHPNFYLDAPSWNSIPEKPMNSVGEDWMHGNRYQSEGGRYSRSEYV